ncbi:MAG: hypothetical protein ACP5T3_01680 [Candidatus Micrarchaeia archaeon]
MFSIKSLFAKHYAASITSVNISYMNDVHQLPGLKPLRKEFELRVPFRNKTASDLADDTVKRPDLRIDAISVKQPFALLGVLPSLPIILQYGQSTELVLRLKAPDVAYTGPLFIDMQAKMPDSLHIGISSVKLSSNGRTYALDDSAKSLYISKGDAIKQDVQALAILHEGDEVKEVSANAPFAVLKTSPQVPFKVNSSNSMIISVYLKAPDYNYSGPLELTFK